VIETPLLVLGFNRPENTIKLFNSLRLIKPKILLFAVDGPRSTNQTDLLNIKKVQQSLEIVDWNSKILTRFRDSNLGIRVAIPDAVNWAISRYGRVVVIEDDVIPGPDFLNYMKKNLDDFSSEKKIGNISGYSCVPQEFITNRGALSRMSKYPSSYAWGTWDRAWRFYQDDISDIDDVIESMMFDLVSKISWKVNFSIVKSELVSTWAYRWLASLWRNNLSSISPNVNLVEYIGQTNGTHTRRKPRWNELKVSPLSGFDSTSKLISDPLAEKWLGETVYKQSKLGLLDSFVSKAALKILKRLENLKE
jgi:hypothetical protein